MSRLEATALLLALCTTACRQQPIPSDYEVTLQRTACLGACPVYEVTVRADGSVSWHGERYVSPLGNVSASVPADAVRSLVRTTRRVRFMELPTTLGVADCREYHTCAPWAIVTVRMDGGQNRVRHYHGCNGSAHDDVTRLEKLVDDVVRPVLGPAPVVP